MLYDVRISFSELSKPQLHWIPHFEQLLDASPPSCVTNVHAVTPDTPNVPAATKKRVVIRVCGLGGVKEKRENDYIVETSSRFEKCL